MIGDHPVLGRRQIGSGDGGGTEPVADGNDVEQCRFLHAAAEDATAHQPGIDLEGLRIGRTQDDDSDHAIVPEAIDQPELQRGQCGIALHRGNLALGIAPRCQVELVRLVDQLRDSGAVYAVERPDIGDHVERLQIARHVRCAGKSGAFGIGPISIGADPVIIAESDRLEIASSGQRARIERRIGGHFRHGHHRQLAADLGAFDGIVVEKDQRIEADVESGGDGAQIGRLVTPIGDENGDMFLAQHHVGVVAERRARDILVILGADGEDDPALAQRQRHLLDGQKGLAARRALTDGNTIDAIVTDDAAPQCIVEIEHQRLAAGAADGPENPGDGVGRERQRIGANGKFGLLPLPGVVPVVKPDPAGDPRQINKNDCLGGGEARQFGIEGGDHGRHRSGLDRIEAAKQRFDRRDQRGDDDRTADAVGKSGGNGIYGADRPSDGGPGLGGAGARLVEPKAAVIETDDDRVEMFVPKGARRVDGIADGAAVIAGGDGRDDPVAQGRSGHSSGEQVERARTQQADAQPRQRAVRRSGGGMAGGGTGKMAELVEIEPGQRQRVQFFLDDHRICRRGDGGAQGLQPSPVIGRHWQQPFEIC